MSAGGEAHHSDLLHAPFLSVVAAVAEHVLDVGQRHVPVAVRKSVMHDGRADALRVEPLGGVTALLCVGGDPVRAARADDDHLAVRVLRQIQLEASAVTGELEFSAVVLLRLVDAVGFAGTEGYAFDAFVDILSFRVEVHDLVRCERELLAAALRGLLLAVKAGQLLAEPSFKSRRELGPAGAEVVLADFRIQSYAEVGETPAVTALRVDVEFGRDFVPDESLVELYGTDHRHGLVVGADSDEGRRSRRRDAAPGGVLAAQVRIFRKSVVPLLERLALPFFPRSLAAQEILHRAFVRGAFVHQDDRIDQNREIRAGERVRVHRGHGAGKVSAGGEADDSDLLHAPVRGVVAAVAEGVLHILKRHFAVTVRKAVLHHGAGYTPVVHPFGEVSAFVPD